MFGRSKLESLCDVSVTRIDYALSYRFLPLQAGSQRKNILDINSLECAKICWHCIKFFASHLRLSAVNLINPIPTWGKGAVLVRLKDSPVVALMDQMSKNCSRSTRITSIIEHETGKNENISETRQRSN